MISKKQDIYNTMQNKDNRAFYFYMFLVVVITLFTFYSVSGNKFIVFMDDGVQVVNNLDITNFSFAGIKKIFSSYYAGMYQPVTTITYLIDYHIYGLSSIGFHLSSLFYHLIAVILVFLFLSKFFKNNLLVFILTLIFAVHPTCIESVAWISARSNIIFTIFYLVGLNYYYNYISNKEKRKNYYLTLLFFILSCFSKPSAVTFPLVLVVMDMFLDKITFKKILEKLPFFIISLIFGLIALDSRTKAFQFMDLSSYYSVWEQVLLVFFSIFMYIKIFIFPYNNSAYYPYPENTILVLISFILIVLLLVPFLIYLYRKKKLAILGLLFFIFSISIMLKFVTNSFQIISDRYLYLPMIGLLLTSGYLIEPLLKKNKSLIILIFVLFSTTLVIRTMAYNDVWKDEETLVSNIVKIQPDAAPFKNCLAATMYKKKGDYGSAYNNRGNLYKDLKDFNNALSDYNKALLYCKENSDKAAIYTNIGIVYAMQNDFLTALKYFNLSIDEQGDFYLAFLNRGKTLALIGNYNNALDDLNNAIEYNPNFAMSYYIRGMVYYSLHKRDEACKDLKESERLGLKLSSNQIINICN